ncbi:MAG: efflux RND transporter periplasmic adaptor subunit [Planctomycetes bacterium]|nr:efflux RND transporter periplasmic adaptor subunit [Planctomycetota bacterium]
MDRPTFSQSWSRVSRLTPMLRPHVHIHRQLYRGEPWHIVHDPITNQFFRLNPVAYHFIGLLDGRRQVDDAWRMTLDRFGDSAPTQNEVIGLLGQFNEANLLRVDLPADAEQLLKRQRRRVMRQWGGQFLSIMSLKFPVFNPDKMLRWLSPLFRPFLSKWGLIAWALLVLSAIVAILPHTGKLFNDATNVLAPANWAWMALMFTLIKAWHELGHGLVCRRFGGMVPEVGVMMLVLLPAPYVDATSSWNFPSKWHRVLVSTAGMMFELLLASIACFIWVHEQQVSPGSLTQQLAYNVIFLSSVTTILFNANPLLRFDGYYILSDILEIPNLYQRAGKELCYLVQKYAFGMPNAQSMTTLPGEQALLVTYSIVSQFYKVLIMFSISLFVAAAIPSLGILLAIWTISAWAIVPVAKFGHWLIINPSLDRQRPRAIAVTALFVATLVVSLGMIDVRDHRRAIGVVESAGRADLNIQTDGFIRKVLVEPGQRVHAGDVLVISDNPELRSFHDELAAQLDGLMVAQRETLSKQPIESSRNQVKIETIREQIAELDKRLAELTLRAPCDGVVVGAIRPSLEGQFFRRGQPLGQIEDLTDLRVTAMVDQEQNAAPFFSPIQTVELRTASRIDRVIESKLIKAFDSGRSQLPHPSLSVQGGGTIATDPEDRKGATTQQPQFELWLELPPGVQDAPLCYPGERVNIRFTLETRTPLAIQWYRRIRQIVRERLSV